MAAEDLIAANDFCTYHEIEYTFIHSLEEAGLVHFRVINEQKYIPHEQLPAIERMSRLHHDLDINIAGIASIMEMLERMEQMRREIKNLQNRLRFYDENH